MTKDEFIEKVRYYMSDEFLQEQEGMRKKNNLHMSPEEVAFASIRYDLHRLED